ncbi:Sua5/YciO/YrdC/YwlC family protein [Dactylosporangium sp. NPDC051485]|uniref:L-threonylcarbamoyladenylate synthase n=1 Tax=Dactylosporangium sp. NPDC051485 TaxID=3154846 RepID=UPI0034278E4F
MAAVAVLTATNPAALDAAGDVIDAGGIVAMPTRRWYMLCADSGNEHACGSIFAGKGRPMTKPLALVLPTDEAVTDRFVLSPAARRLADRLWPGDLALRLPWRRPDDAGRRPWLGAGPPLVTREPGLLGALAGRVRNPIAAAVVSRSDGRTPEQRAPALSAAAVLAFADAYAAPIDLLVDGGVCPLGIGLTVVDCTAEPVVVRAGAVHERAVEAALRDP